VAFCEWKKNPLWVWRAIDGIVLRSLGWVLGDRSDASLHTLVQKIDTGTCAFMTDEWGGFFRILPENRHFWGKDLTFPIEGTNSDIRHRLARFKRKTKASSRSLDMVNRSLLLFHYFQDYPQNLESWITNFLAFFG
jgi:insertion element IS1 protein InsB